jgi:hypothetical protein
MSTGLFSIPNRSFNFAMKLGMGMAPYNIF